jgi:hypothetical protein
VLPCSPPRLKHTTNLGFGQGAGTLVSLETEKIVSHKDFSTVDTKKLFELVFVCLFVCLSICLSVCLSVCLSHKDFFTVDAKKLFELVCTSLFPFAPFFVLYILIYKQIFIF